ncbi:hypothetical protein NY78_2072 [Desulfovibrio sp. TomC]|nr:hypothetical protein NY78_2072 [Desulfovibrio sp. TomC]
MKHRHSLMRGRRNRGRKPFFAKKGLFPRFLRLSQKLSIL